MYQEALKRLIIKGIIGFAIGFILTICISPEFGFWGYCLIGFVMAVLIVFLVEKLDKRIRSEEDIMSVTKCPILGMISRVE